MFFKEKKIKDKKHLRFIASLPCLICGIIGRTQAAHIRTGNGAGAAHKSGDDCTLPLCCSNIGTEGCHERQGKGEHLFWFKYGGAKAATELAKKLYENTGDRAKCIGLMIRFKQ